MKAKTLVVGLGSIGKRHVEVLNELSCEVYAVSRHLKSVNESSVKNIYSNISDAFKEHSFDYVVIATETSKHKNNLDEVLKINTNVKILVEKPLYTSVVEAERFNLDYSKIFVGYNLRFHRLFQKLSEVLKKETILSANAYVGQHLEQWRTKDRPYTSSYSASAKAGGGVLLDLSHELDYLSFLLGKLNIHAAIGGHISSLKTDAEDTVAVLASSQKCPVISFELNCVDRFPKRFIYITTEKNSYCLDFIKNELQINDVVEKIEIKRNDTYTNMHQSVLNGETDFLCSYEEALMTNKIVDQIKERLK
jgi:predicted dehydrogenase